MQILKSHEEKGDGEDHLVDKLAFPKETTLIWILAPTFGFLSTLHPWAILYPLFLVSLSSN